MVNAKQVKQLRDMTGCGMMECKYALDEAGSDIEKAGEILRKSGAVKALKKSERSTEQGIVEVYIHAGSKVGVLVKLFCETDFVAKNEEFRALAYDIAMQIAATEAEFLNEDDIKEADKKAVKEILKKEVKDKPKEMQDKILAGKLDSYFKDRVLLKQAFIKNPKTTIEELIKVATQKFGERIEIGKFVKYSI